MDDNPYFIMSGRLDSNQRPPAPHAGTLPGCATSRQFKIESATKLSFSGMFQFAFLTTETLSSQRNTEIIPV